MITEHFNTYLEDIKAPTPVTDRVEDYYNAYNKFLKLSEADDEIKDVFVTDVVKEDGRVFENLWFFCDKFCLEAKHFLKENRERMDMTRLKGAVVYWEIAKENFDFAETSAESRFCLFVKFQDRINGMFKASGKNCFYLYEVFNTHIKPNIRI
jgi:hypothetical protein